MVNKQVTPSHALAIVQAAALPRLRSCVHDLSFLCSNLCVFACLSLLLSPLYFYAMSMVVFHQCMDKEWAAWGRDSAREMAAQGFSVVRVRTMHYADLRREKPEAFNKPLKPDSSDQAQACAVMMRDVTLPMIGCCFMA